MLKRVPTVRTSFTVAQLIKAMSTAWIRLFNVFPKEQQIAVLYAHWALETGVGSSCWNNNIGNIKAVDVPGQIVEYCVLNNVWEIVNGKKIYLKPEDPGSWFLSFRTLADGVLFYFNFLRNKRYKIAWSAVEQGDPIVFSKLLKQQGYYTASEASYSKIMKYHFDKFVSDTVFEKVLIELKSEFTNIDFPSDYKPIDIKVFDIKDDAFFRRMRNSIASDNNVLASFINKFKKAAK